MFYLLGVNLFSLAHVEIVLTDQMPSLLTWFQSEERNKNECKCPISTILAAIFNSSYQLLIRDASVS